MIFVFSWMWLEVNVTNTGGPFQRGHRIIFVHDHRDLEHEDRVGAQVRSFLLSNGVDFRMSRRTDRKKWIAVVFLGWTVLAIFGLFVSEESPYLLFYLLLVQQALFVIGGVMGSRSDTLRLPSIGELGKGIVSGIGLFTVNTLLGALMVWVFSQILGSEKTAQIVLGERSGVELFLQSGEPGLVKGVVFLLIISAPVSEELFFRGLLLDYMRDVVGPGLANFTAALIFAMLHFYVVQFIPVLAAGIFLGILFLRSGNIYRPIVAHATANGLALAALITSL